MEFKFDAKDQYTVITPLYSVLDASLSAELAVKCAELLQNGSNNFIVDMVNCKEVDGEFLEPLVECSAQMYEQGHSFVLVQYPSGFLAYLKDQDAVDSLNFAPTMQEAIDIVSMEILERDLLNDF